VFAAGYDIRTETGWEQMVAELDAVVGLSYLRGVHVNDSKAELGSRVDRHHSLGKGRLGMAPFECLMNDVRFDGVPLILETIDPDAWPAEIELLRSFQRG
jgi:deoxyribonuclease-4